MCVCVWGGGGGGAGGCTEEMLARSGFQLHLTVQDAPKERKGRSVCVWGGGGELGVGGLALKVCLLARVSSST